MAGTQPNFINQMLEIWNRLTWKQRASIAAFSFLGIVMISALVYFMNRVEYEALYRDLNAEDAQAIAAKLKEEKKEFIVERSSNGTSILVAAPKKEIDKLWLDISGSGLGKSGKPGYEIFDKNQFGMTDFTEQINLQRATEGELSRTICSLAEIAQARVHIVFPKDSIYADSNIEAKASVVLTLKKGAELSKSSVSGIKGVIAGAVRGLNTHNISIVDDEGRLLSQSVESGDAARADYESGVREQLEKEMSGKVVSILEPLVGKGNVHANASIDLDFNTTEQTEETFNPNPPAILSQQKMEERAGNGGGAIASGIPGIASNLGQSTVAQAGPQSPERVRHSETTNYEVNRLVRHTMQPKGNVRRLSVAVILDNQTVWSPGKDGNFESKSEPRSQKDIEAYRDLVLAAVGFNEQRGDVVKIENVPFFSDKKPDAKQTPKLWYDKVQMQFDNAGKIVSVPILKYSAFIVVFLLTYFLFFRPLRNRVFQSLPQPAYALAEAGEAALSESAAQSLSEGRTEELPMREATATASLPPASDVPTEDMVSLEAVSDEQIERELIREANTVEMGGRKFAAMKKKLTDKARKDPEMISQLVRTLLRERP